MIRHIPQFRLKYVLAYYAAAIGLCLLGSSLAYLGPISSDAWQCWSGKNAWIRDGMRAVVASMLCILALAQMHVVGGTRQSAKRDLRALRPSCGSEFALFLIPIAVPLFSVWFLGSNFKDGLSSHPPCASVTIQNEFRQIWLPYVPYLFYMYGLWLLIVFPVLLFFFYWVRIDVGRRHTVISQFSEGLPSQPPKEADLTSQAFEKLLVAFQSYVIWLKEVAERYLFLIIIVALGLLYEQLTPSRFTVTEESINWAKTALWLLLGPALVCFVILVALGYQRTANRLQFALGELANRLACRGNASDLFDRIVEARSSLIWERSSAEFVLGVAKSATVAMPLIIALGGYVLQKLSGGEWIEIFIPKSLIKLIQGFYS